MDDFDKLRAELKPFDIMDDFDKLKIELKAFDYRLTALENAASSAIQDAAKCVRVAMADMSSRLDALEEQGRDRRAREVACSQAL